ncbi:MAG: hypothetical protein K1Y02_13020 [Candidatus Hydrogenedentes bacterium]|nr:hypothetical protein [Candidatus Hydrogenedentota bacterium]
MKHGHSDSNFVLRGARWVIYASVLTAAFFVTMGIAYTWVVQTGRAELQKRSRTIDTGSEAELLEDLRQETKGLFNELDQRAVHEKRATPSTMFTDWLQKDFNSKLSDLRRRIQDAPLSGDSLSTLLVATDGISAWAKRPADDQLRANVSDAIMAAEDAVDQRIGALRAGLAR